MDQMSVDDPAELAPAMTAVTVGCKLQVMKTMDDQSFWREAEILALRPGLNNTIEYYVHYTNFNKRLDEWVASERLDLNTVKPPKADKTVVKKTKGGTSKQSKAVKGNKRQSKANIVVEEDEQQPGTPEASADLYGRSKQEEIEALRRGGSMTTRPEEVHRVKNINYIIIGQHQVETWYFSPYPQEYALKGTAYICEFCLCYFDSKTRLGRHREKCTLHHPPGNEIYRKDNISFYEIDGHKQKTYCRNLCLLSKLFLDHKTLYYDVNPFLFYVMTQNDDRGCHIVGYFSKEKESADSYNVACILTLPNHQRKGYGRLLIQFSYELSKVEGRTGSPEKPLSDLGLLSYRSYWAEVLLQFMFETREAEISIEYISSMTCMTNDDILHTLQHLDMLRYYNGQYIIVLSDLHEQQYQQMKKKKRTAIDPTCLDWKPPQFSAAQLRYI